MTTRKSIIEALAKHGQCTYDDIERHAGITRDKARIAISDAKKSNHLTVVKDDFTGQPAYKITPEGRTWLNNYGTIRQAQGKAVAPIVPALIRSSDRSLVKKVTEIVAKQPNKSDDLRERITPAEADLVKLTNIESELATWKLIASTVGANTPDELKNHLTFQDGELVDAVRKANECQQKLAELEIEAADKISGAQVKLFEALKTQIEATDPIGYIIASPNKPLRRFKKNATAQAAAIASARASGLAEVFAIYPHGKAVRGVEWRPV